MWPNYIRFFEQSLNENYNTTTGFTPKELQSGKQPTRFWERYKKKLETQNLPLPLHIKQNIAKTRIEQTADQRARVFNDTHKTLKFQEGEMVLLKANPVG